MNYLVKNRSFYKSLMRIMIPMGFQQLLLISVNAVDSFMLGSINEIEMTAVAICNQIFFVYTLLNYGICLGGAMLISQYWGKKDRESIKTVMAMVLRYGMVIAGVFAGLILLFPEAAVKLYNTDPKVVELAASYLRIAAFFYILYSISVNLMQSYRSIEKPMIVVISNLITYTLNIGLNYCLIFGHFGFPKMGIQGAALGSLIARLLELLIMLFYMRFIEKDIRFRFHDLGRKNKVLRADFIRTSKPVMGHELVYGFGMTISTMIMGQISTAAIAAYNVAYILQQIVCAFCTGLSNASQVLIGKTIGSGKKDQLRSQSYTFLFVALCYGVFAFLVFILAKDFVISMYNLEPATKALCEQLMYAFAVVAFLYSFETVTLVGILRGGGDAKTGFYTDVVVMWCIGIPLALIAAFILHASPVIVYLCLRIDMPLKDAVGIIKVLRMKWVKDLTQSQTKQTA